jgi:hypothetical protein
MFLVGKNGDLLRLMNGKTYHIYKNIKVYQVLNYGLGCYFVSGCNICKYVSNYEYKVLMTTPSTPTIYMTLCSNGYLIANFDGGSWIFKPKIKIDTPGQLVYYSKEFIIVRCAEYYNLISDGCMKKLFPAHYEITFIDQVTPLNTLNLHIHAFILANNILEESIFLVNVNTCDEIYKMITPNIAGPMKYFYVIPHKNVFVFTENGMARPQEIFIEHNFKVLDCTLVEYTADGVKLSDLREYLD